MNIIKDDIGMILDFVNKIVPNPFVVMYDSYFILNEINISQIEQILNELKIKFNSANNISSNMIQITFILEDIKIIFRSKEQNKIIMMLWYHFSRNESKFKLKNKENFFSILESIISNKDIQKDKSKLKLFYNYSHITNDGIKKIMDKFTESTHYMNIKI
jgi:hypothetical protein